MSTYYTVLGVHEQATTSEIRRAYRRLVLLTHPDRTPDPAAHRRYLTINEAYETLSNAARRQHYDARLRAAAQPPPAPARSGPASPPHTRPMGRFRGAPAAPGGEYAAQYARLAPYMRLVAAAGAMLALLMLLDAWQTAASSQIIQDLSCTSGSCRITTLQLILQSPAAELEPGNLLQVYTSPWFGQVQLVKVASGKATGLQFGPPNTYNTMWFMPLLMSVAAVAALWPRLPAEQVFKRAFTSGVFLLLSVCCLLYFG